MGLLEQLYQSVIDADEQLAAELTEEALKMHEPEAILDRALRPAMDMVGEEYERGVRYIPEMLLSADAMKSAVDRLRPRLTITKVVSKGVIVIGTVEGDLHDIGINLVAMMLEGTGFEVHRLGVDVPADGFVTAVREKQPDILGMSALLTSTMPAMSKVIDALKKADLRERVKVLIGGAPVSEEYAREIGADGYARDAGAAVRVTKALLTDSTAPFGPARRALSETDAEQ
ncbi:corrinoid protein [Candidatus Bipolaricaulota bacterium]|nr:corrinoid protein [Candidatus Bipolaricaulota bacterium]